MRFNRKRRLRLLTPAAARQRHGRELRHPTVTIAIKGFTIWQIHREGSGFPNLRIVTYPGVIQTHEAKPSEEVESDLVIRLLNH